ncbi:AraC family transcriptional regulator [Actinoplanes sp. N902-109]|uniref:AraC family transcriptional regulator n=1 Tax=Actinoplanes sp. (strain N902-109) TaxID=649831 RepID=UPI000685C61C|nr:AraC family transcriptional regulator [Actinoplanes sp. N902-109]
MIRQSSVLVGRTGEGAPVYGFDRSPGSVPIVSARLPAAVPQPGIGPHAHDFLVLGYAERAAATVLVDGRKLGITDGDLFVLSPGQVIGLGDVPGLAVQGWVVWFPADVVRSGAYASWRSHPLLFPFARGSGRAQRLEVPPADRASWTAGFAALDAELRTRRDGYRDAALAHLMLLLVGVARLAVDVAGQLREANEPLLAAVFDVIERRYAEPISLADVAAELALTAGHLTTVVRRRTGRTVQQWITQRRLQEARALLSGTDLTVAAIGRRVGYPDAGYFIRRFRAEHRMTPARWREG